MSREPQLLLVWNPLFEPRTIKVHVDLLRKQGRDRRVWWGRIYAGNAPLDKASLKTKWGYVLDLHRRARKEGRDLVVFVTDYQSLHALKVDYVRLGPGLPEDTVERVPPYYLEGKRKVGLWFQVRDIRALTHHQLHTLEYFREIMGVTESPDTHERRPFDPYAAFKHDYPVIVHGPSARQLFSDKELHRRNPNAKHFADLRETVFPPDLQTVVDQLKDELGHLWDGVQENTQIFLACARLVEKRCTGLVRFDFSAAVCEVAKAVETELIDGLLEPLSQLPPEVWNGGMPDELRPRAIRRRPRSLGSAQNLLERLAEVELPASMNRLHPLGESGSPWCEWLKGFTATRNEALHSELVDQSHFTQAWSQVTAADDTTGLLPVLRAREQILETLLATRGEGWRTGSR